MSASTVVNDTSLDNVAPVAEDAAVATTEAGAAVEGQLVATDAEGDALTFALDAAVEGLTLNADGSYTFDPSANTAAQALTYTDQPLVIAAAYTVTDALGAVSESKTLSITVEPTPLTIELVADANFVEEGSEIAYTLVASEAIQGEDITGTIQILPGDGTTGQTGAADFGSGSFNPQTVTIAVGATTSDAATITPTNDAAAELPESYTASATVEGFEIADLAGEVRDPSSVGGLGQTFTLTTGIDTIPGLQGSAGTTGTDGADTIVAVVDNVTVANSTLNALDQIDAGLGEDTLTLNSVGNLAAFPAGVTVSNVETMNVRSSGSTALNTTTITGLADLNSTASTGGVALTAATTTDVTVSGETAANTLAVDGGQNVSVTDTNAGGNITIGATTVNNGTITVTDDIAAATIAVDGGTDVSVTATGATNLVGNAITVGAGGAATDLPTGAVEVSNTAAAIVADAGATAVGMGDIAVTGGTTVNVTQSANAANGVADNVGDVVTQGDVTVTAGNSTTSVTVVQDDQAAAVAAVAGVDAVRQTQTVTFNALVAGNTVTVNGLTFTASVNLSAEQVAQAFANLTSGDRQDDGGPTANGFYTGINTANTFTTGEAVGNTVTYTETTAGTNAATIVPTIAQGTGVSLPVAPTAAVATTGVAATPAVAGVVGVASGAVVIDDNATASVTDIVVDSYNAATLGAGGSLNALQNLTLKNSGATAAALTSTSSTLNVTLDDVDGAVNLGGNVTNLTLNTEGTASTGAVNAAAATGVTINAEAALTSAGSFAAATTLDINGSAAVNLTGATLTAMTALNAADNTGGVTATANANTVVTGSSAADTITFGAATVASNLGAGNDTAIINQNALGAGGSVDGGEGDADTLSMGFANAVAASANTVLDGVVTNFERLTINNVATDGDNTANATHTVNLANLTYDYVTVSGTGDFGVVAGQDTLALTGMAANGTVALAAQGLYTVALADASGTADVVNYVLDGGVNGGTVTANAVETFSIASTGSATNTLNTVGDAVTTISVSGNAGLNLAAANATLTTVDASAMTAGGLQFTVANASSTITGGAGADVITVDLTADSSTISGGAGNDTFTIAADADLITLNGGAGADTFDFNGVSSNKSNYTVIQGVDTGDIIDLAGLTLTAFNSTQITLAQGATESTQAYLDQAMATLTTGQAGWFSFNGNTFIAGDVGAESANAFVDGQDFVVMITGVVDLSTASFNSTVSTVEIA
jgi:S-layer protein